jgi:hypothetical protein
MDLRHHRRRGGRPHLHGRPARLIVFFLEAPTVPQKIDEQLDGIWFETMRINDRIAHEFQDVLTERDRHFFVDHVKTIRDFIKSIRGEVISMTTQPIQPPSGAVTQLVIGDPVGIMVAVLEADDSGAVFFPPAGPLQFAVSDPSNTVKQGVAADGVTPTFLDNGSGNTGEVEVTVTDAGNNLVGSASFAVVEPTQPPPPPDEATQLGVFFVPAASGSGSASASASATADAVKAQQKAAGISVTDPHNPGK